MEYKDPWNEPNNNEGYYGYIYITTNLINGKIYIGKKEKAKEFYYIGYLGSGKVLRQAIEKYGRENFDVELIGWYETRDELNKAERFWIKHYNSTDRSIGYNRSEGGDWGDITVGMTPEEKAEWSAKCHRRGFHLTEDHKRKISESERGKIVSDETKQRLRDSHLGKKWSDESRAKVSATRRSPEYRAKVSEKLKNRKYTRLCVLCNQEFTSKCPTAKYCIECKRR